MLAAGFHTLYVRLRSAPQAALLLIPAADRCLRLHRLRLPCRHRTARPPFPAPRAESSPSHPRSPRPPSLVPRSSRAHPPRPHPPRTHRPRALPRPHPSRAAPTVPRPAVHPPHRACTHSPTRLLSVRAYRVPAPVPACLPTEVLKLQDFSFYQSISSFVVSLPNLSKRCEGATVPARTTLALRNCHSVSDFIVSLPNVSKKDVKGLLFRK